MNTATATKPDGHLTADVTVGPPVGVIDLPLTPLDPHTFRRGAIRVGLDLDGCFYSFHGGLRHYLTTVHGADPAALPDPVAWDFGEAWGITREAMLAACRVATDAGILFAHEPADPADVAPLHQLAAAGMELHVITARDFGPSTGDNTRRWLADSSFPHHSVTYTFDKTAVWTDYMLEDNLDNYDALVEAGTHAVLINRPWNQDPGDSRHRVDTVAEFAGFILDDAPSLAAALHRLDVW